MGANTGGRVRISRAAEPHPAGGRSEVAADVAVIAGGDAGERGTDLEPLADLDYRREIEIKSAALDRFWRRNRLDGVVEGVVPSPRPRGYRTTSKRRVAVESGTICLFLGERPRAEDRRGFVASSLEPQSHAAIYRHLREQLAQPRFRAVAYRLSYVIVRGTYERPAVIFNLDELNAALVRKLKALAEGLDPLGVVGVYAYLDPTHSAYYLESWRPRTAVTFKRLRGPELLSLAVGDRRYRFHPTSFSQVNQSLLPAMLDCARRLLRPQARRELLDLYCGYGLFSHYLAPSYARVTGIDIEGPSIRSAIANCAANPTPTPRRFQSARVDRDLVADSLRRTSTPEVILLDPPRNGTSPGVIAELALRSPEKVLHVFCDVDAIPRALAEWSEGGMSVDRVVPLDMFPGSANLEVMVLLLPARGAADGSGAPV